jgi:hypothetical protein
MQILNTLFKKVRMADKLKTYSHFGKINKKLFAPNGWLSAIDNFSYSKPVQCIPAK